MRITNRERRDWTLIIFIIPIGIILMMIAGQIAVRIVPQWSVKAGMKSQLDPQTAPKQQVGLIQPVLPEILTPIGWLDTFLTPNSDPGNQILSFLLLLSLSRQPHLRPQLHLNLHQLLQKRQLLPLPHLLPLRQQQLLRFHLLPRRRSHPDDKTPIPPTATPVTPTASPPPPVTSTIDPSFVEDIPAPVEIGTGTPDGNYWKYPARPLCCHKHKR